MQPHRSLARKVGIVSPLEPWRYAMTRAVVLGGGGPVGIAWESGLAAGLAETGVDLAAADFIMGTSAGSVVGAQLALGRPAESLARTQLANAQAPNRGNPTPGQA